MGLMAAFNLSAGGLAVQKARIDVTAENLANINSTRTPDGGPYRKKEVIVSSVPTSFDASLQTFLKKDDVQAAEVTGYQRSDEAPRIVHDPSHPDADANGNVAYPSINSIEEMIDMMTASKAYEANITVYNAAKSMVMRTLEIGG
ncbi:flagellar basal body rod protein FlgC [bacterium]|nr:flagellar basal body rod protein FlgC [bacterium]